MPPEYRGKQLHRAAFRPVPRAVSAEGAFNPAAIVQVRQTLMSASAKPLVRMIPVHSSLILLAPATLPLAAVCQYGGH